MSTATGLGDLAISASDYDVVGSSVSTFHGSPADIVPGTVIGGLPWSADSVVGHSQTGVGDVDGDGYGDMTLSWDYSRRYTFVLSGSRTGPSAELTDLYDFEGSTSFPAGDLDGDGFADLIVAYPSDADGTGRVDVWLGSPDGLALAPDWSLFGEEPGGDFGRAGRGRGLRRRRPR